jgi:hypothetical protein
MKEGKRKEGEEMKASGPTASPPNASNCHAYPFEPKRTLIDGYPFLLMKHFAHPFLRLSTQYCTSGLIIVTVNAHMSNYN